MRKAVIDFGRHTVREQPTGGWCVSVIGDADKRISVHGDKDDALAAAQRYEQEWRAACARGRGEL